MGCYGEKTAPLCSAVRMEEERGRSTVLQFSIYNHEVRKMARHRRLVEHAMQHQLALLGQVRERVTTAMPHVQAEIKGLVVE